LTNYRNWLVLAATMAVGCAVSMGGCGGNDGTTSTSMDGGDEGGGSEGGGSEAGNESGITDGGTCSMPGATCATSAECCSVNCNLTLKICVAPIGTCKTGGTACSVANECCTFVCNGGTCGSALCISDNKACTSNASCCGGVCSGASDGGAGTCTPLNGSCRTSGNTCATNGECCSSFCNSGVCSNQPSFCTQTGDICSTNTECCGGICTKASGATIGTCKLPTAPGTTGCTVAGEVCGAGADAGASDGGIPACGGSCCSRSCAPYALTGVDVCQAPSGCHPTGDLCRSDKDCCGSVEDPGGKTNAFVTCSIASGESVGRCNNGGACRGAGAICKLASTSCNAENNCCAGNVNNDPTVCQQDIVGIPRCTGVGNCADAGTKAGLVCSSSADCCGLACVPTNVTDGGAPLRCGASCVPRAGGCTTTADCCTGLPCVISGGSTSGSCGGGGIGADGGTTPSTDAGTTTCAQYGQTCAVANCCNGVPCSGGRCLYPQ
jgi:hypothetical protein